MSIFTKPEGKLYAKAEREFWKLAMVDADPARMDSIESLVYIAQFEIDLFEAGESTLTAKEIMPHRKFVTKWNGVKP